jgi:alpha-tubulin suppressor-like RCC1 family protein
VGFDSTVPGDLVNPNGVLGTGSLTASYLPAPVAGGLVFRSVVTGGYHTCGVTTDNVAYCWGKNQQGSLGIGTDDNAPYAAPQRVLGGLSFASIAVGGLYNTTCGLTTSGAVYCWGYGTPTVTAPLAVVTDQRFASVAVAGAEVCALTDAGSAYCWATASPTPAPLPGGLTFTSLTMAYPDRACGLTRDNVVYCWSGAALTPVRLAGQGT